MEANKIKSDIERLINERNRVEADHKKSAEILNEEYKKAKEIYDNMKEEISLMEENLEDISFGLYKPHYDFSTSEEYKRRLEEVRDKQKRMIAEDKAAYCPVKWTVQGSRKEGERMTKQSMKLMLRAFNGECDANVLKVRWDNVTKMEERIKKAFEAINKLATVDKINITDDYRDSKLAELRLAYEYQEKLHQEKEEQRRIQEQIREEEKVQKEIEKAKKEAEDDEARYQKALEKAREEISKAKGEELEQLNDKIKLLEGKLEEAQKQKERAISRAQQTKSGFIYIISNIGSFGENVYKVGMTRRLEPMERVRELGDSSVPFTYDVHAMIYSDNAPELEYALHQKLEDKRVNMVNPRREFYSVTLDEIEKIAKDTNVNVNFTKIVEAREYRETLSIKQKSIINNKTEEEKEKYPVSLF